MNYKLFVYQKNLIKHIWWPWQASLLTSFFFSSWKSKNASINCDWWGKWMISFLEQKLSFVWFSIFFHISPMCSPSFVAMCVARQEIHQFDPQVTKVETFWEVSFFFNSIHVSSPCWSIFSVAPKLYIPSTLNKNWKKHTLFSKSLQTEQS